ncbi:SPOR domain-containing protein [Marivita sp. GX14005]|uniref:SPOR domain-containing protein n=1 Tax=Marivita sp. GX14005 TaxID=2942276 RepID=UPI0020199E7A|nr:SPOR domain-containing protein [Marivita sp. GX14005]MCL3882838.1 SPOR domain-containing protein [Marivita sp. GX14005]
MADIHMTGPVHAGGAPRNLASAANWLGAAMSLALIVGVAVWGYRLIMRDVSGVPVVRAIEGPMRVAPDDPGGKIARHNGLAVNDIAGTSTSAPPPDQLVLAPQPLDITDEDVPVAQLAAAREAAGIDLEDTEQVALASFQQDAAGDPMPLAEADIANAEDPIKALADQIAAKAEPLGEIDAASGGFSEGIEVAALIPASVPGVARSLRPSLRPSGLRQAALSAPEPAPSAAAELSPDNIPAGTRLVQFGAYDSAEIAREQWAKLDARFDEYLDEKSRVIEKASSGGRVFYRLRAHGFADLSDSRRFCAALLAEGADCIPVVSR